MPNRRQIILASAVTLSLALLPASYSPAEGITPSEATCQDGTCCPEPGSTCIIGIWQRADKYAKLDGGACKAPPETQPAGGV